MSVEWKCAISGVVPEEPVLSKKSGFIFEKRLLLEYVKLHKKDPINHQLLDVQKDIVVIKRSANDVSFLQQQGMESSTGYSIPNLLNSMRTEWDAVMLENFTLRHQLQRCKEELSDSLFKYDSSVQVCAAAMKERDFFKKELARLTKGTGFDYGELVFSAASKYLTDYKKLIKSQGKEISLFQKNSMHSLRLQKIELPQESRIQDGCNMHGGYKVVTSSNNHAGLSIFDLSTMTSVKIPHFAWIDNVTVKSVHYYEFEHIQKLIFQSDKQITCFNSWAQKDATVDEIQKWEMAMDGSNGFWYLPHIFEDRLYVYNTRSLTVELRSFIDQEDVGVLLQLENSQGGDETYSSFDLHKDGMLFAIFNKSTQTLEIYDLSNASSNQPAQQMKVPVLEQFHCLRFSKNGYHLYLECDDDVFILDLRKDLEKDMITIAETKYVDGHLTSDNSGKNLFRIDRHILEPCVTWFHNNKSKSQPDNSWNRSVLDTEHAGGIKDLMYIDPPSDKLPPVIVIGDKAFQLVSV